MPRTDPLGNRCDHCVRVHIRHVHNMKGDVFQAIRCAQKLYGKNGILFEVATLASLHMKVPTLARLAVIDTGCDWNKSAPDQAELYARFAVQDLSSITAFFVQALERPHDSIDGCAGHLPHRPSVFLARTFTPWTLAHEVGHVLLTPAFRPVHHKTMGNLMHEKVGYYRDSDELTLDEAQLSQVRKHPLCAPC